MLRMCPSLGMDEVLIEPGHKVFSHISVGIPGQVDVTPFCLLTVSDVWFIFCVTLSEAAHVVDICVDFKLVIISFFIFV